MRKLLNANLFFVFLVPVVFLVVSILTLNDYGINWDSPKHFIRGQSYLHFILTGKRDFLDLPVYQIMKGEPDYVDFNVEGVTNSGIVKERSLEITNVRRSYFQSDFYTFDYFMTKHIHTHPEVNDLLLAATNYIFYQKMGVMGDIESYHFFIVLVTFALVAAVSFWTYRQFGSLASIVSSVSLVSYPLVFSELHFNVKDPILMSFFGLSILSFHHGVLRNKSIYILLSSVFAGFALGTKFNAFFLIPILGLWFLFVVFKRYREKGKRLKLIDLLGGWNVLIAFFIFPFISLFILYIFSPYLWIDPVGHFMEIVEYYKSIGTETLTPEMSRFLVRGWNTYPVFWIINTTPLPILFVFTVGICYSMFLLFREKSEMTFLILLWFFIPIVRVIWPGTNIYGGVRQIMEFIPAMAILSGVGANWLVTNTVKATSYKLRNILQIILLFVICYLLLLPIIKYHPNQNVYFNKLIGGLKGAKEKNMPSWGNTYGNVYLQGIEWLNDNVEKDAKLALPVNYISSIPRLKLRGDIDLDNHYFSGTNREGEYAMEMDYDWPLKSRYKYSYYDTFLDPVYEAKVDGVTLLKIWKNEIKHTKVKYLKNELILKPSSVKIEQQKLVINFTDRVYLTKLVLDYSTNNCEKKLGDAYISLSDDGKNFIREPNPLFDPESPESSPGMDEDTFVYMFAAKSARSIVLNTQNSHSCILKDYNVKVMGFPR